MHTEPGTNIDANLCSEIVTYACKICTWINTVDHSNCDIFIENEVIFGHQVGVQILRLVTTVKEDVTAQQVRDRESIKLTPDIEVFR